MQGDTIPKNKRSLLYLIRSIACFPIVSVILCEVVRCDELVENWGFPQMGKVRFRKLSFPCDFGQPKGSWLKKIKCTPDCIQCIQNLCFCAKYTKVIVHSAQMRFPSNNQIVYKRINNSTYPHSKINILNRIYNAVSRIVYRYKDRRSRPSIFSIRLLTVWPARYNLSR